MLHHTQHNTCNLLNITISAISAALAFLFSFEIDFYFALFENVRIDMEQLFAVQIDAFRARNPQRCELRGNLMKHKVWGVLLGALGADGAV